MKTKLLLPLFAILLMANYTHAQNKNVKAVAEKWFLLKTGKIAGVEAMGATPASLEEVKDNAYDKGFCEAIIPKRMMMVPVKILNFSAACYSDKVTLSWSTFAEERSDCFIIEKSLNGTDWVKLAEIRATGKSDETNYYSLNDYNDKGLVYYRIKKGVYDGHMTYYHVVMGKED